MKGLKMRIYRFLTDYKEFVIGFAVIILFLLLKDKGSILKYFPVISVAFVIIVLSFGVGSLLYRLLFKTKFTIKEFLNHLNKNILLARRPFVVQVRNTHIPGLVKPLSRAVHSESWWDWSYFGAHPDCGDLCANVSKEIEECYLSDKTFKKTKTSTLRLVEDYPLGRVSKIFFGDIMCTPKFARPTQYRPDLFDAIVERQYELFFRELYIFNSTWHNRDRVCRVLRPKRLTDRKKIGEEWTLIENVLVLSQQEGTELVWKNVSPSESDRSAFTETLERQRFKDNCKVKFIGFGADSGGIVSVLNLVKSQRFVAKFLIIVGWALSPLTLWNDSLVNIPISFGLASILTPVFGLDYHWSVGFAYLLSNVLGIILLAAGTAMIPLKRLRGLNYRQILIMFVILAFTVLVTYGLRFSALIPFWLHDILKTLQIV